MGLNALIIIPLSTSGSNVVMSIPQNGIESLPANTFNQVAFAYYFTGCGQLDWLMKL